MQRFLLFILLLQGLGPCLGQPPPDSLIAPLPVPVFFDDATKARYLTSPQLDSLLEATSSSAAKDFGILRQGVPSTDTWATVRVDIRYGNQWYWASGTFISPGVILTAGNAVFDRSRYGRYADEVWVRPQYQQTSYPYGRIKAKAYHALRQWVADEDMRHNQGFIYLDVPLGNEIYFPNHKVTIGAYSDLTLENTIYRGAAYPNFGPAPGGIPYYHDGKFDGVTDDWLIIRDARPPGWIGAGYAVSPAEYRPWEVVDEFKLVGIFSHLRSRGNRTDLYVRRLDDQAAFILRTQLYLNRKRYGDLFPLATAMEDRPFSQIGRREVRNLSLTAINFGQGAQRDGRLKARFYLSLDRHLDRSEDHYLATHTFSTPLMFPDDVEVFSAAVNCDFRNLVQGCYYLLADIEGATERNDLRWYGVADRRYCFDPAGICGPEVLTAPTGSFTDGSAPRDIYWQRKDCTTRIEDTTGTATIELHFRDFQLTHTAHTYVDISVIDERGKRLIERLHGYFPPSRAQTFIARPGEALEINFVSGMEDRGGLGFTADYTITYPDASATTNAARLIPNPAGEVVYVRPPMDSRIYTRYELLSSSGQKVRAGLLTRGDAETAIRLRGLPPGFYLIRLRGAAEPLTLKLQKR